MCFKNYPLHTNFVLKNALKTTGLQILRRILHKSYINIPPSPAEIFLKKQNRSHHMKEHDT